MKTKCTTKPMEFHPLNRRNILGQFDGGAITSDGGSLLLREIENHTQIISEFAECFTDHRDPNLTEHSVKELLAQRIYGLALGYEDLNDHDQLRHDPLLAVLVGKSDPEGKNRFRQRDKGKALAGKSTLNRLELAAPSDLKQSDKYKKIAIDLKRAEDFFVDVFLSAHEKPPSEIILDVDATDDRLYGKQEGRFFHGYYKSYCYLPLYIFCGEHLLCAKLRTSNIDGAAGTVEELQRIIYHIREQWSGVRIIVRGDSGFCRENIMNWCEQEDVDYVVGLAKNPRLKALIADELEAAKTLYEETEIASRVFKDFYYQTRDSWVRQRRVIGKAEYLAKGENPRFVVTSLKPEEYSAKALYEDLYCARGEMENRIKEQQLYLFADRTSTSKFHSNQLRLWFSSVAYLILQAVRRIALKGTEFASAQCHTIRLKLLKIGALVRITVRKVWVSFSQAYPYAKIFKQALENLQHARPMRC